MIESNSFPDFNQQLLLHNPKEVSDASGYFWITVKDKNRQDDPKVGVIKIALDNLKPYHPIFIAAKLGPGAEDEQDDSMATVFQFSVCLEKPI